MGWETVAKCDVCGKIKGDSNRWMLVQSWVPETVDSAAIPYFTVYFFERKPSGNTLMACGEECLQRLLQPFLALRSKLVAPTEGPTVDRTQDRHTPAYANSPVETE